MARHSTYRPAPEVLLTLRFRDLTITQISHENGVTALQLTGVLNEQLSGCIEESILLLAADTMTTIWVDLSGVTSCDRHAIDTLARIHRDLLRRGQALALFGATPDVARLMHQGEHDAPTLPRTANPGRLRLA